ncbi:uncharacterized protein AB675_6889 [Cyphellophora attinorum]|uniref:ER-bound oxygenase mpaB/mpaB'/Rubber oxygenase catalytic domain-containing protein n=1 Tax=Cyphellophora attinorum TaxID=1664694 RepID=A0A0N1HEM1_9EURO|nr:uncharacterized protein AB675_6889 [Phialophora attinorum]KPI43482.1 hypothetical protein AB675_6889 [Phialophora attinorum]
MAWPNPFARRDEYTRTAWGYTFQLTPGHLTLEKSHPLKHSYDTLGEECLTILNQISPPETPGLRPTSSPATITTDLKPDPSLPPTSHPPPPKSTSKPKRDLYAHLLQHKSNHPALEHLYTTACTPPFPVDWDQMVRGQDVFYRYAGPSLTGLAYQSLLGGMGAARVVETLARTGGFNTKVARHRLFETTQFILECTRDLESIRPGGDGFASALRVRLLHAAVRKRILGLEEKYPGYYSVEENGVPINDLDCIATIGTFSATLLYLSLPRQGIWVTRQEEVDYIALWRLIAWYTGTPTEWFETPERAKMVMESLLLNEIRPSKTSGVLANNIIRALENTPPAYASRSFLLANTRWLNGHELCDALELGRPGMVYYALTVGQCLFFMGVCYFYRQFEGLDRWKVQAARKVFWEFIVENKYGLGGEKAVFEMKYVPDLGVGTEKDGGSEVKSGIMGVEGRSARALVVGVLGLGGVVWGLVKVVAGVWTMGRWAVEAALSMR